MCCRSVVVFAVLLPCLPATAWSATSLCEQVADGVYVIRDDMGMWRGGLSTDITHQNAAPYQARKVLDLTDVPPAVWDATVSVRVSAFFMVRDFSRHLQPTANGLDEAFEVVVNGHVHAYPTNCGAPVYRDENPLQMDWYDFELPKAEFVKGVNEIVLRKAPSDKNDDYLYLGIDESEVRGNSAVTFDGQTWINHVLTVPGGKGEYMVRMYLLQRELDVRAVWQPGSTPPLADPAGIMLYAGSHTGRVSGQGLQLSAADTARIECEPRRFDAMRPVTVGIEGTGTLQLSWLDSAGKASEATSVTLPAQVTCETAQVARFTGLELRPAGDPAVVTQVTLEGDLAYHPRSQRIDMCPPTSPPVKQPASREPGRVVQGDKLTLENSSLRCEFAAGERLTLVSLRNHYTDCDMLSDASRAALFLVEIADQRYAGSLDFVCKSVQPDGDAGFVAQLELPQPALRATLTARIEQEGLRLGLVVTNPGPDAVDFKLAFPHFEGLTASGNPAADYYYFPWGGGIIADRPASIRRGYGDHEALYQIVDLFSPERGGGLYVRIDDPDGWHKGFALRKSVPGVGQEFHERMYVDTRPEFKWTAPLAPTRGTGIACEYLRRTRTGGGEFHPADALLCAHPGDWHVALKAYADWAHRVWKFRPYPSRLRSIHHMIAVGWGHDLLFRDGKYRDDFLQPQTDCVELMSWWDWAPHGPWNTPFDKLTETLTTEQRKLWEPYFVKDPVTGAMMWNNQPGDYAGYNARFGGLPAFRAAIESYQGRGALVTLYTDPFRLDGGCPTGAAHGQPWTVVLPSGELSKGYDVWNPCHDIPDVRQWVATTMKRVMQETGADGIRLDEYGHKGWACFSKEHEHSFAEYGVSQWNKATAETTRLVRQAMDDVAPGSVLTTEHPAYDYLMQFIDGCITYDLTVQACPLRPLECNTQRFYFPECKAFELDHQGADLDSRKKIWNGVASFGRYFPPAMYALLRDNEDVYQDGTCEPLVPTRMQFVYANQFSGADKMMIHLYNATDHTVDGAVFALDVGPQQHLFDMLALREIPVAQPGGSQLLSRYMPRDTVACIARLTRRMTLSVSDHTLCVEVDDPQPGWRVVACDAQLEELVSAEARSRRNELVIPEGKIAACVKLLHGRDLVDITAE